MSGDYYIIERTPCLPLKLYYSSYELECSILKENIENFINPNTKVMFDSFSNFCEEKYIKYIRRASYRTAFLSRFVKEVREKGLNTGIESKNKIFSTVTLEKKEIYITPYKFLDDNYIVYYASNGESIKLECNDFLMRLVMMLDKKKYTEREGLIQELSKNYDIDDVMETLEYLIDTEFILECSSLRLSGEDAAQELYIVPNVEGKSDFDFQIPRKNVSQTYSIISLLLDNTVFEGEIEAREEFYERYGEKFVSIRDIMSDETMMNLIAKIRVRLNQKSDLVKYIKAKRDFASSEEEINFTLKELRRFSSSQKGDKTIYADIFANVYNLPTCGITLDLDTGHSIYQHTTASNHFDCSEEYSYIMYNFVDPGLIYTSKKNMNVSFEMSSQRELPNFYVGVTEGKFGVFQKKGETYEKVLLMKKDLVNIAYYPLPLQVLLICSDYLNANINLINEWKDNEEQFIVKRIRVGSTILRRKRWNVLQLSRLSESITDFKEILEQTLKDEKIDRYVVYSMGDSEKLLDLNDFQDVKFLYSESKRVSGLWLKEDLQKYSPFYKDNYRYANQLIISPYKKRSSKIEMHDIEISEQRNYQSQEFVTVKLSKFGWSVWDIKREIVEYLRVLKITRYFYVHYMELGKDEFRLRIPVEDISRFIRKLDVKFNYEISSYMVEKCRFSNVSEFQLIKLFIVESKYWSYFHEDHDENEQLDMLLINTWTYLNFFCRDNIEGMKAIIEPMVDFTIKERDKIRDTDLLSRNSVLWSQLVEIFGDRITNLPPSEIRSLIHMSNNKICGINRQMEIKCYKIMYNCLKEWKYRNHEFRSVEEYDI